MGVYNFASVWLFFFMALFMTAWADEILFEGGPSFYEMIYTNPLTSAPINEQIPARVQVIQNIKDWMEVYKKRGVNLFSLPLLDREGVLICDSPALKSAGFRYIQGVEDIFPMILLHAKQKKMSLSIPIDDVAHIIHGTKPYKEWIDPSKIDPPCMARFMKELGEYRKTYEVDIWINEQAFSSTYLNMIAQSCKENQIGHIRYSGDTQGNGDLFCSEDYATYPISPDTKEEDARYLYSLSKWGTASGRIGHLNLMFGMANTFKKRTGVLTAGGWGLTPGCQQNVALYRAVQFAPSLYCFCSSFYEYPPYENKEDKEFLKNFHYQESLLPLVRRFSKKTEDRAKPIGNIILDVPSSSFGKKGMDIFENSLLSTMESVSNGITAAGLEIHVSIRKPLPDAQLYYIFTSGSSPALHLNQDLPSDLLPLFQRKEKIFLQCALGLPRGENWAKIAPLFGLPVETNSQNPHSSGTSESVIPESASIQFPGNRFDVRFRGYHFWIDRMPDSGKLARYHHFTALFSKDLGEEVCILAASSKQEVMLTQKNNFFFINGNFVHFNFSSVICNLIAPQPVFYFPSPVYLTTGHERTALFSADDTCIDICVPKAKSAQIHQWKPNGTRYEKTTLDWNGSRLFGPLKKWELAIVGE